MAIYREVEFRGTTYPSIKKLAEAHGAIYGNVVRRLAAGLSIEQALGLSPPHKRVAHNAIKIKSSIGEFGSARAASAATGIDEATIVSRLAKGWPHDQALGIEPRPKQRSKRGKGIVCQGIAFSCVSEFADNYGKNSIRTAKRLTAGWTPEQAVDLLPRPPRFRNQDGSARDHAWTARQKFEGDISLPATAVGGYRLYLLSDKHTGKHYVGITSNDLSARLRGHWGMVKKGRHSKLYNAMRKADLEGRRKDFTIELLRNDARDYRELQQQEADEISRRDTIKKGYNTAEGGSIGTPSRITIAGIDYPSQAAAAEFFGVDPANFNQRIQKLGWTPEQAAGLDEDKRYGRSVEICGEEYASINSACVALGLDYKTVYARLQRGWTVDEAFKLTLYIRRSKRPGAKEILTSRGMFSSISEAAKTTGLPVQTVGVRLRSGWTPDEALGFVQHVRSFENCGLAVEIGGKSYSSIRSACKAYGLTYKTVHARLRRGWTVDEAFKLTTHIRSSNRHCPICDPVDINIA